MASEFIYITGKCKWFRPFTLETQYETPYWSYVHYPDAESLEKLRELQAEGMKNQIKKDDDGWYVRIKRPASLKRYVNGMTINNPLKPPKVLNKDGVELSDMTSVGNGSDVTTKLEVYQHRVPNSDKKAKAVRWDSTRIDNLVEFDRNADLKPEEAKQKELASQPVPVDSW